MRDTLIIAAMALMALFCTETMRAPAHAAELASAPVAQGVTAR